MKVLITGGQNGQLRSELLRSCPAQFQILESGSDHRLDVTDPQAVESLFADAAPELIINAAAYTAVDKAETEQELAFAVNEQGVVNLATAAASHGSHLIHVSTDFVFEQGSGAPFQVSDSRVPANVYGRSKLAGEHYLEQHYAKHSLIVRTAWVYSAFGNNFVKTMLRLMAERDELGVIADQIGSPTWARGLAHALWVAADQRATGVMHWTGAGVASWYDFAQAIMEEAVELGLLQRPVNVIPLRTDQYPTPAARPHYSVLETTGTRESLQLPAIHWRVELRDMLREMV